MRKVVLDTNCLLMSIPKISPYRRIWDDFLGGKIVLCVTNEIIEEYLEILSQKTTPIIASNIVEHADSDLPAQQVCPQANAHSAFRLSQCPLF